MKDQCMYLFLDTEFTDFKDCDLISLGLVSEDGEHEFYVEITDHTVGWQSDFVKATIVPLLENDKYGMTFDQAAVALKDWIESLPAPKLIIVADYGMDIQLLVEMLKSQAPLKALSAHMYEKAFRDVLNARGFHMPQQQHNGFRGLMSGVEDYFEHVDHRRHHALVDAKANRHGWLKGLRDAERT